MDRIRKLEGIAGRIRGRIVEMSHRSRAAHLGSALSCVDILVALYWSVLKIDPERPDDPNRDRFIMSKGHAAAALYTVLAARGYFPDTLLDEFGDPGCKLEEHPGPGCAPGVEAATGSLGHGLPLVLGLALGARIQGRDYRTVALLGDGECNEGSVWEAAMFASGQKLDRVMAVVDYNKWQATGRSREILGLDPLVEKWRAFGWSAYEVDGHDLGGLLEIFDRFPDGSGRPMAVVAHTVKGKGVSFMEDDNNWHYRVPSLEEVHRAHVELRLK
jgi:transketolase